MKIMKVLATIALVAAPAFTWFVTMPDLSRGQDAKNCAIITMHGKVTSPGAQALLEPETASVNKGTCVIWLNDANGFEAIVKFADGKVCDDATEAPSGFQMNPQNCYVSTVIPTGGTSSLRFMQPGVYAYDITDTTGHVITRGKVMVQE